MGKEVVLVRSREPSSNFLCRIRSVDRGTFKGKIEFSLLILDAQLVSSQGVEFRVRAQCKRHPRTRTSRPPFCSEKGLTSSVMRSPSPLVIIITQEERCQKILATQSSGEKVAHLVPVLYIQPHRVALQDDIISRAFPSPIASRRIIPFPGTTSYSNLDRPTVFTFSTGRERA
ncbi:hypothetical protein CPB86DRAFT_783055 [Serendipita vermifera]|nr:hypothetical protein CPB86DRAFT_783055 [Serendipita vermifera]